MIECPSCGRKHRPGTLFCTRCGVYLPTGGTLSTTPLPTDELPQPSTHLETEAPVDTPRQTIRTLEIQIVDSGRVIRVPASSELFLGREDPTHRIFPDIDLTPDGGLEKGVSRRHAKIFFQGEECYIEDVGSANGTFLNDRRLTPYLPYPLKTGDQIQIGQLRLQVNPQ